MATMSSVKSGKGLSDGLVSELATYWNVLPGHEDELRVATRRFADMLHQIPSEKNLRTTHTDGRRWSQKPSRSGQGGAAVVDH